MGLNPDETPAEMQVVKPYVYDYCPFCVMARLAFGLLD
jgi:hypothetical protein